MSKNVTVRNNVRRICEVFHLVSKRPTKTAREITKGDVFFIRSGETRYAFTQPSKESESSTHFQVRTDVGVIYLADDDHEYEMDTREVVLKSAREFVKGDTFIMPDTRIFKVKNDSRVSERYPGMIEVPTTEYPIYLVDDENRKYRVSL